MASDTSISSPELSVTLLDSWLVLVQDRPGEEVETSVSDLLVGNGESDEGGKVVVSWVLSKSSLPEVSDASWNLDVLSVGSDCRLNPVSENSVVGWFLSDNALDNLVKPLVSGLAWSSSDDLDEVVGEVFHGWSGSNESLSSPSDTGSLADVLVPGNHLLVGEGVSDWFLSGWLTWLDDFLSESWLNWLCWSLWLSWSGWFWDWDWSVWLLWDWCWLLDWHWSWSWWEWLWNLGGQEPSLVGTLMAVPPDNASVVAVLSSVDIEALAAVVSDVLSLSSIVGDQLIWLGLEWSDDGIGSVLEQVSGSARDGVVLADRSDGSGS